MIERVYTCTVAQYASSIIPGGMRCAMHSSTVAECIEILQHTASRMDVLACSILIHRV
jgi:hypothetical protein